MLPDADRCLPALLAIHYGDMPRAIVLQHVAHEDCGRLARLLAERGFEREDRLLYEGDAVPRVDEAELLVVMGGPMGVGDLHDPLFPFLPLEAELIRARLANRLPILGICLGAQLIAHAAGARVYPNSRVLVPNEPPQVVREVGWGDVRLIDHEREPVLRGLGSSAMMLHWHGDTYDLPVGAVLLASTPHCPNQAFRIGNYAVALQFHCEVQAEQVRVWLDEDAAFVLKANGADGRSRLLSDNERFAVSSQAARDRLLNNILDLLIPARPTP